MTLTIIVVSVLIVGIFILYRALKNKNKGVIITTSVVLAVTLVIILSTIYAVQYTM